MSAAVAAGITMLIAHLVSSHAGFEYVVKWNLMTYQDITNLTIS